VEEAVKDLFYHFADDMALVLICMAFYIAVIYGGILMWRYRPRRQSKGNPFRQFKDYQLQSILRKL
jgi:hypothetical protein